MPGDRDVANRETRYGHTGVGGGRQDQGERKDAGWRSRQGGKQSQPEGRKGDADVARQASSTPPAGTNTQGQLPGIGEPNRRSPSGPGAADG